MKVSVSDPGFKPPYRVFLDGTEISKVFEADEEGRRVVVAVLDDRGRLQLNHDRTEIARETRYGHVRIEKG